MSWTGSRSEVARKLELKVINAPLDNNIVAPTIELASSILLLDDTGSELFRGFVTDRETNSTTGTITYVAYDLLYYTLKSKATYNFSGKTAEEITRMVCADMEIPVGNLSSTGIKQKLIVKDTTIYDIIMQAYTQAHEQNSKLYKVTASYGKLNVIEMGKSVCSIHLTEDTNIINSRYTETLANMINKVRIYDGEGNPVGVVQNDSDVSNYGIFQSTYTKEEGKDATTTAKSLLNGIDKTFEFECLNYNDAITGYGAVITDSTTQLAGVVWIDADTHTWDKGVAKMKLTVTLEKIMDIKDVDKQNNSSETSDNSSNSSNSNSSGSTGSGGSSNTTTAPTDTTTTKEELIGMVGGKPTKRGSINNPPFNIVNKYGTVVYGGWENYDQMVRYFFNLPGNKDGWTLTDNNGDEMKW
jgi:hypothetical protein